MQFKTLEKVYFKYDIEFMPTSVGRSKAQEVNLQKLSTSIYIANYIRWESLCCSELDGGSCGGTIKKTEESVFVSIRAIAFLKRV